MATARSEPDLASLAEEAGVEYVAASVARPEDCRHVVEETERRLGPIDILVNNAGIEFAEGPVWELTREVWLQTLATNVEGPLELTRLTVAGMIERGYGRIVMVSSTAGSVGAPEKSAYCASKHALNGLTRCIAQDAGAYGVTCNAVCPGFVQTAMYDAWIGRMEREGLDAVDAHSQAVSAYPARRLLTPDEIAATIGFLASSEASGINGETVTVALGGLW